MYQKKVQSQIVPSQITFSHINPQSSARVTTSLIQASSNNNPSIENNNRQYSVHQSMPQKSHIVIKNHNGGFD
jgi:hypothetical protein